jgi:hypothetical protein
MPPHQPPAPHQPRRRRRAQLAHATAALAATVAALAVAASPASAVPGWLASAPFELPAVDAAAGFGGGVETIASSGRSGTEAQRVTVRTRGPDDPAPVEQASFPTATGGRVAQVRLAVAPDGAAVLAWADTGSGVGRAMLLRAAYRPAGGGWGVPVDLATAVTSGPAEAGALPPFAAHVAIGADGTAVALAEHGEPDRPGELQWDARLDAQVHRPGDGSWETPVRLSQPDRSEASPAAGVAGDGTVTVAWTDRYEEGLTADDLDDRSTVVVRRWGPSNGIWDTAQDVASAAPTADCRDLALAVADDGAALLAWSRRQGGARDVWTARRSTGAGLFAVPEQLPTGRTTTTPLAAAIASDGAAHLLWSAGSANGPAAGVALSRAPRQAGWVAPQLLSAYPVSSARGALVASGGGVVAAWTASGGASPVIQGAGWGSEAAAPDGARDLDAAGGYDLAGLVADGEGSALALYEGAGGLRQAVYDAAPPRLRSASVPSVATAGRPVGLTASVADRWAGLDGAPTWELGPDLPQAGGETIAPVFPAAGVRTVTLRARDRLGNELARSFQIRVDPPPGGQDGPGGPAARAAARAAIASPRCARGMTRERCRRWRTTRAAWRVVRGSAHGAGRVSLRVVQRPRSGGPARAVTVRAAVRRGSWAVRLPRLARGALTLTLTVRPLGADGNGTGRGATVRLRLR